MKKSKNVCEYIKNKYNMRKHLFFVLFLIGLVPSATIAQSENGYGIKLGLNYNANGDYIESINTNAENPDGNVGFHIGVFGKIGDEIYLKPELIYSRTKSDYSDDSFKMQKIDAPILLGFKVLGPLSVFAGPSFQYIINSKFGDISVKDIKNDFSVGLNFGVGFNLKKIGIDLRYERGFGDNEARFLNNNSVDISRLDTRPSQLILGLSLLL